MGLEAATYIHQLNPLNPVGAVDPKAQGDDHLRMIKSALQATFPNIAGAMTVSHTNLNQWGGLSANYAWTGQHTWAQVLRGPDGVVSTPAFSFTGDTDTGFFRVASDLSRMAVGGVAATSFFKNGAVGQTLVENGTLAIPGFGFTGDTDSGLYWQAADLFSIAAGATNLVDFMGPLATGLPRTRFNRAVSLIDGTAGAPAHTFENDLDTGFYRVTADVIGMTCGGTLRWNWGSFGARGPDGVLGSPSYAFDNDTDTGFYRVGANEIGIVSGGAIAVDITNARVLFPDGVVGTPGITFNNDPDTGMYRAGANNLRFATNGVKGLEIDGNQDLYDKNNFRLGYLQVPRSTTTTTFAIGDVGKCVAVSAAINIPASVFSAGDCITVYNDSAAAINITISAGTLRLAGSTTTGTRTLQPRGMATLWFNVGGATPEVIASGSGLS